MKFTTAMLLFGLCCLVGLLFGCGGGSSDSDSPSNGPQTQEALTATSTFSASKYTPGTAVWVTVAVMPAPTTSYFAVEDQIPDGWSIGMPKTGGSYDANTRKVKWGPFYDTVNRHVLMYSVIPPAGALTPVTFHGTASFDGKSVPIGGSRTLTR